MAIRSVGDVEIHVVDDPARLAAGWLVHVAARPSHIALSGGSTVGRAYELAAQLLRDWSRAEIWLGDERVVPATDERSNFRLVKTTLLDNVERQPAIHRVQGDLPADLAAALYDDELDGVQLDLALNGIGSDGHTASIFPASPALGIDHLRAVAAEAGLEPFVQRVTMTPPMFLEADLLVYLVTGAEKASAVRAAFLEEPTRATPASVIRGRKTIAILDAAAASKLD